MNCVGIDVSKGKSMIAVMHPFGEVVISPFEVQHTASELSELAKLLKSLDGETRVVMESTGNYHLSEGAHDGNHAFSFGNIDANAVHSHSSNTKNLQPESIFSRCRFNLLCDANSPASGGSTCSNRTLQQEDD